MKPYKPIEVYNAFIFNNTYLATVYVAVLLQGCDHSITYYL